MQRRDFLAGLGAAAVIGGSGSLRAWSQEKKEAVLKLGSQEGRMVGKDLREKVLRFEEWGGVGLEIGGAPANRIQEIKDAIKGTRVKVSALCWGSKNGDLVSTDLERRKGGVAALKDALKVAGELESTGVIFVPCFHKQSTLAPAELDKIMLDMLPEIAEAAKACNTRVLLEPLNQGETFYINRLEQALVFCTKLHHPGLALMGDFYHMGKEEKSDRDAFVGAAGFVHHVHLASRTRVLPGQDDRSFVEGFRGLKQIGYQDHCSFECGVLKGTDPMVEVPKALRFLEQQWKEATV